MNKNSKKELLFYYESRQNPNGDPGFENQPRIMQDGTIMVTDVRIKRTIRDYAKNAKGETIFVDYDKDGNAVTADDKARELLGTLSNKDVMAELLKNTFDVPLFGALVPIRAVQSKKDKAEDEIETDGNSEKITGPLQFGIGRSTNQVQIINPTISGRFVGKVKQNTKAQFSTFGKFYSVEYALIKFHGAINPNNLGKYYEDEEIRRKFETNVENLPDYLWNGTNELITRSKFPQRSILYIEVEYDSAIYNDLSLLIDEKKVMKENTTTLSQSPFVFDRFLSVLEQRKSRIINVYIKYCDDIKADISDLAAKLKAKGISVASTEEG